MNQVKHILYDLNGPIFKADRFYDARPKRSAEILGIEATPVFKKQWCEHYLQAKVQPELGKHFHEALAEQLGIKAPANAEVLFGQKEVFSHADVPNIIAKVHDAGIKQSILSNYCSPWVYPLLDESGIKQYFEKIIVSNEIGVAKPKTEAYEKAFSLLKEDPKDVLFPNDSYKDSISALKFGMQVAWMPGEEVALPEDKPTDNIIVIDSVAGLDKILELSKKAA